MTSALKFASVRFLRTSNPYNACMIVHVRTSVKGPLVIMSFVNICVFSAQNCLATNLGSGYTGLQSSPRLSDSQQECLPWSDVDPLRQAQIWRYTNEDLVSLSELSEASGSSCRNPDHDNGGPWCFVGESMLSAHAAYCDIETCTGEKCCSHLDGFMRYSSIFVLFRLSRVSILLRQRQVRVA